jgi:4-hydroxybutyrate dehydrogenase
MTLHANWSYPTLISLGKGRISELPGACKKSSLSKPLLVTDRNLASLPITQKTFALLQDSFPHADIFSDVDANPSDTNLKKGLEFYREGQFDGVVAFGGGSGLDLGKTLAFMVGQTKSVWDFEDIGDLWTHANHDNIHPIIAVPTTAGTGSEVGRASVITNTSNAVKKIIFHPKMLPAHVILDPELTLDLPPHITAGTGLDAFAHCLEAFSSPLYHPMSQGIALEGLQLVTQNLAHVYKNPHLINERTHMMVAASMGAVAFQKGLGAIHALSHPIGAQHHTHHGTTNAVLIPYILAFNRNVIEEKIIQLARFLNIDGGFDGFLQFCISQNQALNIPQNLNELGVKNPNISAIATAAAQDPSAAGNPKPLTEKNAAAIIEYALETQPSKLDLSLLSRL